MHVSCCIGAGGRTPGSGGSGGGALCCCRTCSPACRCCWPCRLIFYPRLLCLQAQIAVKAMLPKVAGSEETAQAAVQAAQVRCCCGSLVACPAVDGCVEADTHVSLDCSRCRHERLLPVAVNQVTSLAPLPLQTLDKQLCCAVLLLFSHDFCMPNVTVSLPPAADAGREAGGDAQGSQTGV